MKKIIIATAVIAVLTAASVTALAVGLQADPLDGFDNETKTYILQMREKNEQLSDQTCFEDIPATITLQQPLSAAQLQQYLMQHSIEAKYVTARIERPDGERLTSAAALSSHSLQELESRLQQLAGDGTFKGFLSVQCFVDAVEIEGIQNAEETFLLDTGTTGAAVAYSAEESSGFPTDLAWELEDALAKED